MHFHLTKFTRSVLSKDLLRPAGESMWGKRRPIGPNSLRAMIKQAASTSESSDGNGSANDAAAASEGRQYNRLQPNMIVTVEPGLYFCFSYIEAYFLRNEQHKNYINRDVLERYWAVGGVRIEDCILVTENGYENLTTAPKGEELLKILGVEH